MEKKIQIGYFMSGILNRPVKKLYLVDDGSEDSPDLQAFYQNGSRVESSIEEFTLKEITKEEYEELCKILKRLIRS